MFSIIFTEEKNTDVLDLDGIKNHVCKMQNYFLREN